MVRFSGFILCILITTQSFKSWGIPPESITQYPDSTPTSIDTIVAKDFLVDTLLNKARRYIGFRYRFGSKSASNGGFDCSGFTSYVFSYFGIQLAHSSAAQAKQFANIPREEIVPGDLVFFSGRRNRPGIGHVGIVTEMHENGEFSFVHASVQLGVTISGSREAYYATRYRTAARVLCENRMSVMRHHLQSQRIAELADNSPVDTLSGLSPRTPATVSPKFHIVHRGDSLYSISKRYTIPIRQLKSMNRLSSNVIRIGQKLQVR